MDMSEGENKPIFQPFLKTLFPPNQALEEKVNWIIKDFIFFFFICIL